ncbi:MAG TPA: integrase core domain-containing protein [Burkholderiales bacterium]|jgi:hypothetical protein
MPPTTSYSFGDIVLVPFPFTDHTAFSERFNRSYRDEVLDAYVFADLRDVRQISREWLRTCNEERSHDSLGSLPPALYRERLAAKQSTSELSTRWGSLRRSWDSNQLKNCK